MTRKVKSLSGADRYQCKVCGMSYDNEVEAEDCEATHEAQRAAFRISDTAIIRTAWITNHAEACVLLLRKQIARLEAGSPPEDIGPEIELIGRMMSRRT